jgi:hypothetical protein
MPRIQLQVVETKIRKTPIATKDGLKFRERFVAVLESELSDSMIRIEVSGAEALSKSIGEIYTMDFTMGICHE